MTRDNNTTYEQLLEEERLILAATELVVAALEEQGVTRTELAKRVGKTKGNISQLLSGERNLTLRTLSQLLYRLGLRAKVITQPLADHHADDDRAHDFRHGDWGIDVKSRQYSAATQRGRWMGTCPHRHGRTEPENLYSYRKLRSEMQSPANTLEERQVLQEAPVSTA